MVGGDLGHILPEASRAVRSAASENAALER